MNGRCLIVLLRSIPWLLALMLSAFTPARSGAQMPAINEIMYAPLSPEPEWIEVYLPGSSPVSLIGWHIATLSKSVALPQITIQPDSYVIITKDSTALRRSRPG